MKPVNDTLSKAPRKGSALVEFALCFSVLWALFSGVYGFGYTFYKYNALMTAVSSGAALGSKLTYDTANTSAYTTAVQNMVVYGDTSTGTTTSVPGLTSANVTVGVTLANAIPTYVTVSISNFTIDALFRSFAFNGKPSVTMPYMGQITCSNC